MMSSTETLYLVFLTSGFTIGFGHCIGMCGPIVVSLSLNLKGRPVLVPHILYNAGRVLTYTVLGAAMGATGSFTLVASHISGIQKAAMILAGVLISLMGLIMGGWVPMIKIFGDDAYKPDGWISKGFRKLTKARKTAAYFPMGLLLGLLPCGPVYTALIAAAGAGMESTSMLKGVMAGMGLMFCFGAGTIPALFMVGKLAGMGWLKSRQIIYRIGAVLMIGAGGYFIFKGIRF